MTNKDLMQKLIQYPLDAVIEVYDGCTLSCCENEAADAGYDEENNKIFIS